jgi:quercetin dioxygenase-like cupin family protein
MLNPVSPLATIAILLVSASALSGELPDPLAAGWEGEPVCEKLHEDDRLRILRCTFPPGVGHEKHFHPRHVGYTLSGGRMQVTDANGTRVQDVPSGYTFSNPDGIPWHEALNVGDTTASYLMIEPK